MIGAGVLSFLTPTAWHGQVQALLLLIPLVIAISVVYKTIKLSDLAELPRQAAALALTILGMMAAAALVLWTVVSLI